MSLQNMILYRLPEIKEQTCSVCGEKVTQKKEAFVRLWKLDGSMAMLYRTSVPFCVKCGIPYADGLLINKIRYELKSQPEIFVSKKRDYIIREIERIPKETQKRLDRLKHLHFPIVEGCEMGKTDPVKIVCNYKFNQKCLICGYQLSNINLKIPVAPSHVAVLRGSACPKCRLFYCRHSRWSLRELFKGNKYASNYVFDENHPADGLLMEESEKAEAEARRRWRAEKAERERKEAEEQRLRLEEEQRIQQIKKEKEDECSVIFESDPKAVYVLFAEFPDGARKIRIIDKKSPESSEKYIFKYSSPKGLECLSAAFAPQRDGEGVIDGVHFRITDAFKASSELYGGNKVSANRQRIRIEKDGGNFTSVFTNLDCVLVDLLLYSPFSQRFEIMESTYNKRKKYYYTDIYHFRDFVHKHGKPEIYIEFSIYEGKNNGFNWEDLNSQSILNAYGYTVNAADSCSANYRQDILAEMVDLDFLTIREICDYLIFFISSHPREKDDLARSKWEEDLEFISHYRYNPERFLIPQ